MSSTQNIQLIASAALPTRFGIFTLYGFYDPIEKDEITVITIPKLDRLAGAQSVPVRIHSACHTGDTFSSLRCDCQSQLHAAQRYMVRRKCGMVIYLPQEGRGIGLVSKIKAYHLQDLGMDTAEANTELGFQHDLRDYRAAAEIIHYCGIESITLLTNNPDKMIQMENYGITVKKRIPIRVGKNRYNRSYLRVKRDKFSHDI